MWWIKQPQRLKNEVAAIDGLTEREIWLTSVVPCMHPGLKFCIEFDILINETKLPFTLEYPAFFPDTPPLVIPRDGKRLSSHQYGTGGELCLEYRSDNWVPSVTGSMMIESAFRLLSGEQSEDDQRGIVASAHQSTEGQRLRGTFCRFLLTPAFQNYVGKLSPGAIPATVTEIVAPKKIYVAYVSTIGIGDKPDWREPGMPHTNYTPDKAIILKVPMLTEISSELDQGAIDRLISEVGATDLVQSLNSEASIYFVVIADQSSARMLFSFRKDNARAVIPYDTLLGDAAPRLPNEYSTLAGKKVGIVGCGSLGSKIGTSLARTGVDAFVIVDDDILKPGNLVRHDLDVNSLGAHKVDALEARMVAVAPSVKVSARRVFLGGQESSGNTASVLDQLATCDLLIDATAEPQAFNLVAAVARSANRPMIWAEVYAGGIGGFVARIRPNMEPPPHTARQQYLGWCRDQAMPWRGIDQDYGTTDQQPLLADDSNVSVIAAHAAAMAIDTLTNPQHSRFPYPAYAIGLSKKWIFEAPFDTRPLDFVGDKTWASPVSAETSEEAIEYMVSLINQEEHAN